MITSVFVLEWTHRTASCLVFSQPAIQSELWRCRQPRSPPSSFPRRTLALTLTPQSPATRTQTRTKHAHATSPTYATVVNRQRSTSNHRQHEHPLRSTHLHLAHRRQHRHLHPPPVRQPRTFSIANTSGNDQNTPDMGRAQLESGPRGPAETVACSGRVTEDGSQTSELSLLTAEPTPTPAAPGQSARGFSGEGERHVTARTVARGAHVTHRAGDAATHVSRHVSTPASGAHMSPACVCANARAAQRETECAEGGGQTGGEGERGGDGADAGGGHRRDLPSHTKGHTSPRVTVHQGSQGHAHPSHSQGQ